MGGRVGGTEIDMAVSRAARAHVGPQAHTRLQQLYASAEDMRLAADAARAQHGEASHEYSAALDSWNFALRYLDLFIHGLLTAAMDPGVSACCGTQRTEASSP